MPWTAEDALKHTRKADTPKKRQRWATIANAVLAETRNEGFAIRVANACILPRRRRKRKKR